MTRIALLFVATTLVWQWPSTGLAGTPKQHNLAGAKVKQVLTLEANTNSTTVDRRELLHPTSHPKTASDAEWWQSGFVQMGSDWQAVESLPASDSSAVINRYLAERAATPLTANGHLKLADWCRDAKLPAQERAHLSQVLMRADELSDRTALYRRMGFQRIGNQWASATEIQQWQTQTLQRQAELRVWRPVMERIVRNWNSGAKRQKMAKVELDGIHVKSAIPALTAAVGSGEPLALAICDHLKRMDGFESSQALATISVQADWPSVRKRAIDCLKDRRIDDFAPLLLGELHSPFVSNSTTIRKDTPKLIVREDADRYVAIDVSVVDVTYQVTTWLRQGKTTVDVLPSRAVGVETILSKQDKARRIEEIELEMQTRIEAENDRAEECNGRAAAALAAVSGQEYSPDPRYWWAWWHLHTGTDPLPKRYQLTSKQVQVPTFLHQVRPSCLVAGTEIYTDRGFLSVDRIQVGDRVLAKDITTGEVAFKSVLHTTTRAPVPVKSFTVAGTKITASDGHHFWISGDGWKKTRELEAGQPVHTATGMERIKSIEAEPELAPVYNLVVADFHTYFVGSGMILSHDVLPPSPTNVKVPGLEVEVDSKSF